LLLGSKLGSSLLLLGSKPGSCLLLSRSKLGSSFLLLLSFKEILLKLLKILKGFVSTSQKFLLLLLR